MKANEVMSVPEAKEVFADSPEDVQTIELMLNYLKSPEENESKLIFAKERVRALHQRMDHLSKKLDKLKALIEVSMFDLLGSSQGSELETEFIFGAPRTTIKAKDNAALCEIALGNGVTPEEFASRCTPLTAKTFGEILGYTQEAIMNNYEDLFVVSKSKPTLKRRYEL